MVTADHFRDTFEDDLKTFDAGVARSLRIAAEDSAWLVEVGLPGSAAPFLDFGGRSVVLLPWIEELWSGAYDLPAAQRYRVIGSDGSGDPVCLDLAEHGAVVYLNHDSRFARVLVNSSVRQLAAALVAYANLVANAQAEGGDDAFLKGDVPEAMIDEFVNTVLKDDAAALAAGTMWTEEIAMLLGRRAERTKVPWWRRLFGR